MENKKRKKFAGNSSKIVCSKMLHAYNRERSTQEGYSVHKQWNVIYVGDTQLNARFSEVKKSMSELKDVLGEL